MSRMDIRGVSMRYGKNNALQDVTFSLEGNQIYGLFGPNGAGKTTLLRIMSNQLFPETGQVLLDGESVVENDRALRRIFFVGARNLYPDGRSVGKQFAQIKMFYPTFDLEEAGRLSDAFGLDTKARLGSLSTGYQSIFRIVAALCSNTPVVLYDEPVLGLDVNHRERFYGELLAHYVKRPQTILLSTHLIEEAAGLLENVILLCKGKLVLCKKAQDLVERGYTVTGPQGLVSRYAQGKQIIGSEQLGGMKAVHFLEESPESQLPPGLERSRLSLQSICLYLTKEERGEKE